MDFLTNEKDWIAFTNIKLNGIAYHSKEWEIHNTILNKRQHHPIDEEVSQFLIDWYDTSSDLIYQKTSGSTGTPKIIPIKKIHFINSALMTCTYFGLSNNCNGLLCLSPKFIAGKMMLIRAMVSGMNLDTLRPSHLLFSSIDPNKSYDFCAVTPSQLLSEIDHPTIANFQNIIIGGGPFPENKIILLNKFHNTHFYATYGMTETVSHIALRKLNEPASDLAFQLLDGFTIATDEDNRLIIYPSHVNSQTIHTNDIVELTSPNRFMILGRYDNVIISGGLKINPERIEEKLKSLIPYPFIIFGQNDPFWGEILVILIELKQADQDIVNNFKSKVGSVLERHEIPKKVFTTASFTYTETGKIDRQKSLKNLI